MNIILGVTGSIAASLTDRIKDELVYNLDATVKVIGTEASTPFINTYSDNLDEISYYREYNKVAHIDIRDWADLLLIAPLSANTLGKISNGLCDNLLTNIARAWDFNKKFIVCPSMNVNMYEHPITKHQLNTIQSWGIEIRPPQVKTLFCGQYGIGAMCDVNEIIGKIKCQIKAGCFHY